MYHAARFDVLRPSVAIVAAILGGALLGALAAALVVPLATRAPSAGPEATAASAHRQDPAGPAAPGAEREGRAHPAVSPAPSASASVATAPAAPSAPPLELEGPLPDWLDGQVPATPEEVEAASQRCARGDAVECMRAGSAYEAGRGVPPDARLARLNRSAGARLFEQGCRRRDPEACHALSVLYALGRGVPTSPKTAAAYRGLARDLCQVAPSPVCSRLGGAPQE
ncbi:MAG TPA: hypothetical protein PLU22_22395 [Polyangiaceae bacterium]|nr:hypothetical protein [Polyangiaceae bacterium]